MDSLLVFVYGIASESIPDLIAVNKKEVVTSAQKEFLARKQSDTFIIPAAPRNRMGANVTARISAKTNAHILVEFGLQLFHIILKREKLRTGDFRSYIDPVVPILCDCLKAQHVKLTTIALKCMSWILKMDLPSLKENIRNISISLFKLLHKYASAGLSKGDNFDLVVAAFKVVAVVVRDVEYYTVDEDQMKALLLYAEQDMHDFNRQATAFALLKAVISRKLATSTTGFSSFPYGLSSGQEIRTAYRIYVSQLDYKVQSGRESALEMILSIIKSFPEDVLKEQAGLLYVTLGARLVNDDSPDCRKMVAHCIKCLLEQLDKNSRDQLFDITVKWFREVKVEHRRLSAQLCGIFITIEKSDFVDRLDILFPVILNQFNPRCGDDQPGKFVRAAPPSDISDTEKDERIKDHHLFQVLQLILKLCTCCPDILKEPRWQDDVDIVTENCQVLLAHPHEWVRLAAAQVLGYVFSSLDANKVAKLALSTDEKPSRSECGYFYTDLKFKLKSLILDLCAQLQPADISASLIEQVRKIYDKTVVKNLVFLGRILRRISLTGKNDADVEEQSDDESEGQIKLSLLWMIQRMRRIANVEMIQTPNSTVMRMAVFKWIGAMVVDLGRQGLPTLAYQLLAPIARELINDNKSELFQLAKQVSDVIKKKLGMEAYTRHLSQLQNNLAARRADRKKRKAIEVMTEPEKAAKRKIKKNLKKRESKKKRIENIKGKKFKKKRVKEFDIEDM
ncbi:hypothetical protein L9F63_017302 [Diploptera punctata]|uniref:U3 small nucleolar RNA-associated protein 20 C-terminal domain-containing protein n=1 Tax=Diploptera punctata TaxID=6984 RepID=A0AAD7ZZU9_DIPPU|nr:hypothetical protein L9F63_017302 [Diploptera punctata]